DQKSFRGGRRRVCFRHGEKSHAHPPDALHARGGLHRRRNAERNLRIKCRGVPPHRAAHGVPLSRKAGYNPSASSTMTRQELLSRISINPDVCFGKPCIRGHRIWVSLILDFLASGMTAEEILQEYPDLSRDDILACIAYGAEMARERYVDLPAEANR